ncbi:hypothetical protein [Desulfolutivibrio sulfoxidireducens]|uniref:hypothetical protein n=1 Tax=Desulfolutivibrio sulfoxidireducens TaxID=2773299 RepID=UPI00159E19C0|nr:hypothetical protein [Desulfolutivibrio sulfoxidireducens]QLA18962.1 hypothetical protein GD604_04030 [Desulfolutivibrio sulfoxidireducens]
MSGYVKLADKDLKRHIDPVKRAKIARAKLREQITGRLNQAQRLLLDTMIPMALELDTMAQQYGQPDFDMTKYMQLQASFRQSFERLQVGSNKRRGYNGAPRGGFDLAGAIDA